MDVFNKELFRERQIHNGIMHTKEYLTKKEFEDFISLIKKIPSYIKKNGLYNSLTYITEDKGSDDKYEELINSIIKIYLYWIVKSGMLKLYKKLKVDIVKIDNEDYDEFLKSILDMSSKEYMSFFIYSFEFFNNLKNYCGRFKKLDKNCSEPPVVKMLY